MIVYNHELRKRIKERGLTQEGFSRIVGEDPTTISRIVNGYFNVDPVRQLRFAKVLKCKPEDLFGND